MKILVVLGHPNPESFNRAVADNVVEALSEKGHDVIFHDLAAEGFDALITTKELARECRLDETLEKQSRELCEADGIVIVHPNWWGMPPAIMKGWIDRVFRPGVAYRFEENDSGEGVPVGLLKAKTALVINTTDTESEREQQVFGDPLETIWKNCIFGLCGVNNFCRRTFGTICTSTPAQRKEWLEAARKTALESFAATEEI